MTQAERLFTHLRRRAHTTMEMLALGISVAPWKRVIEGQHYLRRGEKLVKGERNGRVTYSVKRG
jgi:hypothetical protein